MIDPVDALRFQLGAIAGREPLASFLSVLHRPMDEVLFLERLVPIGELDDASIEILKRGQACDVYVGAAPRSGPEHDVVRVWCLWVDVDDADALKGLGRFEPQPAIVIQTSTAEAVPRRETPTDIASIAPPR